MNPWDDGLTDEQRAEAWNAMPPTDFIFACFPLDPDVELLIITPRAYVSQKQKLYENDDMLLPWLPDICEKIEKSTFSLKGEWMELAGRLEELGVEDTPWLIDFVMAPGYLPDGTTLVLSNNRR